MSGYQKLLDGAIADIRQFDGEPQAPCDESEIQRLVADSMQQLRAAPPTEYLDFLRQVNGLDFNGVTIFGSRRAPVSGEPDVMLEGFVEANLLYRDVEGMEDYLVIGEDGEVVYVYELKGRSYSVRDRVSMDPDVSGLSFDALLTYALETHAP